MKTIDLFLQALNNRVCKGGILVSHYFVTPQLFPAIKEHTLEIWLVNTDSKELILLHSIKDHDTSIEEDNAIKDKLVEQTMEKLLEYYGL